MHVGDDVAPPPLQVPSTPAVVPDATVVMAGHVFSVQVGTDGQLPSAAHVIGLVPTNVYEADTHAKVQVGLSVTKSPPGQLPDTPAVVPAAVVVIDVHVFSTAVTVNALLSASQVTPQLAYPAAALTAPSKVTV